MNFLYFNFIKNNGRNKPVSVMQLCVCMFALANILVLWVYYPLPAGFVTPLRSKTPPFFAKFEKYDSAVLKKANLKALDEAFINHDERRLAALYADLRKLSEKTSASAQKTFKILEDAYLDSIYINSISYDAQGAQKTFVRVSGISKNEASFITFSDYICRKKGVTDFIFEIKNGPYALFSKEIKCVAFDMNFNIIN